MFFVNPTCSTCSASVRFASGAAPLPPGRSRSWSGWWRSPRAWSPGSDPRRDLWRARPPCDRLDVAVLHPVRRHLLPTLPATLVTAAGMAMAFIPSLGLALLRRPEAGLAAGLSAPATQIRSARRAVR